MVANALCFIMLGIHVVYVGAQHIRHVQLYFLIMPGTHTHAYIIIHACTIILHISYTSPQAFWGVYTEHKKVIAY